jgi:hypothetical protein
MAEKAMSIPNYAEATIALSGIAIFKEHFYLGSPSG